MNPRLIRKFKGVPYQYHNGHENRADAVDEKKALLAEGNEAKTMKDSVYGLYHVYVRVNEDFFPIPPEPVFDPDPLPAPVTSPPEKSSFQYNTGLDFLKMSFNIEWADPRFMQDLRDAKENWDDPDISEKPFYLEGGLEFNFQRTGTKKYPFVLKMGDVTLMFSSHQWNAQQPNCRVEIGSVSCWSPGWFNLIHRILSWLRVYGAKIREEKVSELHVTVDIFGLRFTSSGFSDIRRWVCRANEYRIAGKYRTPNYIALGKGNFMLRIYDKVGELIPGSAKEIFFRDLWTKKLNAIPPEDVTRIEFQIRREVSKELQINTIQDLKNKMNGIWEYCVNQWARFTENPISEADRDNKNHQRYETAALWNFVKSVRFEDAPEDVVLERKRPVQLANIDALVKQGAGCLLRACAALSATTLNGIDSSAYLEHSDTAYFLLHRQIIENFEEDAKKYKHKIKTGFIASAAAF
ncbi:MAG: hypothetical protein GY795_04135 [Desulfobacterales bacterium]|nr:hypothetical protein [Desulfobacterales bacterium]